MALITYLTKIQFDLGALALVPEELAALGIARRAESLGKPSLWVIISAPWY